MYGAVGLLVGRLQGQSIKVPGSLSSSNNMHINANTIIGDKTVHRQQGMKQDIHFISIRAKQILHVLPIGESQKEMKHIAPIVMI